MNVKNSRDAILNQALTIFGQLGFHKTTMADIANASKKGRRTIYTYFKNKEEVYEAVVEREIDRVLMKLKDEIASTPAIQLKFEKYLDSRIRAMLQLTKNYDALKIAFINNYRWVEKIRERLDVEEKKILLELYKLGITQQHFTINDVEAYVKNTSLIIKGIELMLIREENENLTTTHIKSLQHLLLYGLLAR